MSPDPTLICRSLLKSMKRTAPVVWYPSCPCLCTGGLGVGPTPAWGMAPSPLLPHQSQCWDAFLPHLLCWSLCGSPALPTSNQNRSWTTSSTLCRIWLQIPAQHWANIAATCFNTKPLAGWIMTPVKEAEQEMETSQNWFACCTCRK